MLVIEGCGDTSGTKSSDHPTLITSEMQWKNLLVVSI